MFENNPKLKIAAGAFSIIATGFMFVINDLPDLQEKYIYRSDYWNGTWSSNGEYLLPTNDRLNLLTDDGRVVIELNSAGKGSVHGQIITEGLCEFNPVTWNFFLDSDGPSYLSLGRTREFVVSYLKFGQKVPIARLKLSVDEVDDSPDLLLVEKIDSAGGLRFPEKFGVGKDLPGFDEDAKILNIRCAHDTKVFHKKQIEIMKNNETNQVVNSPETKPKN